MFGLMFPEWSAESISLLEFENLVYQHSYYAGESDSG